jgi:hypothetical protein
MNRDPVVNRQIIYRELNLNPQNLGGGRLKENNKKNLNNIIDADITV